MKKALIISLMLVFTLSLVGVAKGVEESMVLQTGDYGLPAIFETPDTDQAKFPAVLMIHGFGSTKNEVGGFYENLADELAEKGIATLMFDFPGSGDSEVSFAESSVSGQIDDAKVALNWLVDSDHVQKDRIGVIGFSLGGIVASCLAGSDERVKAITLWSTPAHTVETFRASIPEFTASRKKAEEQGSVEVDLGWRKINLSDEFFDSLYSSFPLHDIRGYNNPLLVVAGEKDSGQPQDSRELVMNTGSYNVTLRIIEDAGHIYNVLSDDQTTPQKVVDLTSNWFEQWL